VLAFATSLSCQGTPSHSWPPHLLQNVFSSSELGRLGVSYITDLVNSGGDPLLSVGVYTLNGESVLESGFDRTRADSVLTGAPAIEGDIMAQVQLP